MCGKYELITKFEKLPSILKKDLPPDLEKRYEQQKSIKPNDPVIVLKNEGKTSTSLMVWGFISNWAKDPFDFSIPKPFNARAETIKEKKLFIESWKHKRCVLPASGFYEKGYLISRKDSQPFWLAGIWNRWMSRDGSELDSCCVLTTKPNELIKPLHDRMPVIIPNELIENWLAPVKGIAELKELEPMLCGWSPDQWVVKPISKQTSLQMCLF